MIKEHLENHKVRQKFIVTFENLTFEVSCEAQQELI